MADLTYTSPIQLNIVPIPEGNVVFEFKLKGHRNRIKVNVDVNIYYKDPFIIGRVFLANSGLQNVYTRSEDITHIMNFKIPKFQNYIQSHIYMGMEPIVGPYDKVAIEDIKISVIPPPQPIIVPQPPIIITPSQPIVTITPEVPTDISIKQDIAPKMTVDISSNVPKGTEAIDDTKIVIASIVRDEERDNVLIRFLDCCLELETYHKNIVYIFIEGDSSDRTYDVLKSWVEKRNGSILEKIDRGYSPFQSDRDTRRTIYFAELRNKLLELAKNIPDASEVLMIDANYGWKGDLINLLREVSTDIAAPLVYYKQGENRFFYDIWAFRKDGREFSPHYPYITGFDGNRPMEVDSVGGCYLIKRKVLDANIRYNGDNDSEHVSFCNDARDKGFKIVMSQKAYVMKGGFKD